MKKLIKTFITVWMIISLLVAFGFIYTASMHQSKISEMYKIAGLDYENVEDKRNLFKFDSMFQEIFHKLFSPKGAQISFTVLNKGMLFNGGMGDSCKGNVTYTGLFRDDIDADVYKDSELCCMTPMVTEFLPMVYDKSEDRVLVMCGLAGDAHIVSMKADKFNAYFSNLLDGGAFSIEEEFKSKAQN